MTAGKKENRNIFSKFFLLGNISSAALNLFCPIVPSTGFSGFVNVQHRTFGKGFMPGKF
jgi:hypothetical protein